MTERKTPSASRVVMTETVLPAEQAREPKD